ncbi:zinc finger protein 436-like [Polyodon spathula]|uniref:zinc finger protein 436-like n=1 Tax=Polyodon spathula TaxID=7913 RepID=UPI001B7F5D93|nr:zinc finger protein 436-like [Polyodon spathula]
MDVSISVSFLQDELASTVEHAVKAAVDTVLCEIAKVVGSKLTEFQVEMAGKQKENEILKLRLEISESELKAVRECMGAAGAGIEQPAALQDPIESHAVPESEAVYKQEEPFEQEWCARLMQVTELAFVKDEEVPQQECVPIKEEFIEQECVPVAEEVHNDSPSECEVGFREYDSTPSPHCKNSSSGKPQHNKHRETTLQEENVKKLRTHSVIIPSLQNRPPLTMESTETPHSACFNSSEAQGNLKTLSHSMTGGKSSCQLGSDKTHEGNRTGGTPLPCAVCGKSFKHLSHLKRHQLTHTGEKPYHCTECGKRFSQLNDLKRHQRIHTEEKPYCCSVCGKSFTLLGNLQTHKRIHTEEKPYCCTVCGKSFSFLANFKIHQRIHTGEKPYHCAECGKRFSHLVNLKRHYQIHTRF